MRQGMASNSGSSFIDCVQRVFCILHERIALRYYFDAIDDRQDDLSGNVFLL
jgi:hypothetical protein